MHTAGKKTTSVPRPVPDAIAVLARHLAEFAPALILDRALGIVDFSPRATQLLGWAREAVLGRTMADAGLLPADWRRVFEDRLAALGPDCARVSFEMPCVTATGEALATAWLVSACPAAGDDERFFVCTLSESAAGSALPERPEERESLLRAAVRASGAGAFCWDRRTDQLWWSDRYCAMLGVAVGAVSQLSDWLALIHPGDRPRVLATVRRHVEDRRPYAMRYRIRHAAGQYLRVVSRAETEYDGRGQPLRTAGLVSDITDLDEREHLLDFALRASRDGVMYWDVQEDKVWWSERYAEILGMQAGQVTCREEWQALLHPADRAAILAERLACARAGKHFLQEYRMRHAAGHYVWVSVRGQTELDAGGNPVRQVALITDITERRSLLEELREAHELAQLHLQNTPLIYIKHDGAFVIEEWSPRAEEVLGWPAHEAVGRSVGQLGLFPPSGLQFAAARYAAALVEGSPVVRSIAPCCTKDGRRLSMEWFCRVIPDEAGGIGKVLAFGLDRSDQVAAERALQQSEERLNLAMRATNDGMYDWNLETGRFWGSPRYAAILGFPAEEIELPIDELRLRVHPDDAAHLNEALIRHFTNDEPFSCEYRILNKDGVHLWHYARGESVFDENGKAKRLVGVVTDITQRKIWEHELAESERRFRSIADSTPVIIWLLAPQGECVYANRAFIEFTGRAVDDELGMGWLDRVMPQDRERLMATLTRAFELREEFTVEWRHRHQSGEYRWVRSNGVPRFDDGGGFSGYIGTTEDIDAQRQAWAALETANHELLRSNAELEQFAYVASHDLQEPLRMVASFTQLLAKKYQGRLDQEADEYIHFAVDGAKRMQKLIQDLLAFSRVGRGELQFATVDVNALVDGVCHMLREAVVESNATVTRDDLPPVRADAGQLAMVFQNLIGNSLKYRDPARAPRIHVSARPVEAGIEFTVTDNGIGFEPRYAGRIFVIFQRLHTRGDFPGTGIGLAIVKKVVERLGGRVRAEGRPGEGASFHFVLPA